MCIMAKMAMKNTHLSSFDNHCTIGMDAGPSILSFPPKSFSSYKQPKPLFFFSSFTRISAQLCFNRFLHALFSLPPACHDLSFSRKSGKVVTDEPSIHFLIKSLVKTRKYLQSLFVFKNARSLTFSFNADHSVFPLLLRSCASISHLDSGKCLHGYLIKGGFVYIIDVNTSLIDNYLKRGKNMDAYQLFVEMPSKEKEFYDFVICGFGAGCFFEEVLVVFEEMLVLGFFPCFKSVCNAIMACGELRRLDKGRWIHSVVVHDSLDRNVLINNLLISMYLKMGELGLARSTFDLMGERDVVSWNSMITGYSHIGNWAMALNTYLAMKGCGSVDHNNVTLLGLAFACGLAGKLDQGKSIHGHCIRAGLMSDFRLGTAILDMYAKCRSIVCAEMLFEQGMFEKSLVSWNSLISGYSKAGYHHKAVILFKNMCDHPNLQPDSVTLASVIPAYSGLGRLEGIRSIHASILKKGLEMGTDVVLGTAIVDAYGKCFDIAAAAHVFSSIKESGTPTWNAMFTAYYVNNNAEEAMLLFRKMVQRQVLPDAVTIVLFLQCCGQLGSLKLGSMAHGYSLTKGFHSHINVENTMLDMYMRCGSVENSEKLFRLMNMKNIVTWNTMLSGCFKISLYSSSMKMFSQMQQESHDKPDSVTLICLIQASAIVLRNYGAGVAHAFVIKLGFVVETAVVNSLIDAYAKNGFIYNSSSLFFHMGQLKDRCSWNVMIAACGMNGQGDKLCDLLNQMNKNGYEPDSITFTSLLSTCAHSGMIDEGCMYFDLMVNKYNIHPNLEHWTCIIDMFGRAGRLEEAYQLLSSINQNPSGINALECDAVWGAFLDACVMYKSIKLGELAGRKLLELSPQNSGYPILLSNLYASTMKWNEVMKVRRVFVKGSLVKEPGFSALKHR